MSQERIRQPGCPGPDCHLDRERKMVVISPRVHCDPCIERLVRALNAAGIQTVASCCGHGFRPGWIALRDGRQITVARNLEQQRRIEAVFPLDINGETMTGEPQQ